MKVILLFFISLENVSSNFSKLPSSDLLSTTKIWTVAVENALQLPKSFLNFDNFKVVFNQGNMLNGFNGQRTERKD